MIEDDETHNAPDADPPIPERHPHSNDEQRRPSQEETARLASVAFGGTPGNGGEAIAQFGCPQCSALVSSASADEDGRTECPSCRTEVFVPEVGAHAASELNQGMRPASLPSKKNPDQPDPALRSIDPEIDDEVRTRLKRDSQHRLNPRLKPKLQPIDEVRAEADGAQDNWVMDESKYIGHVTGAKRFFRIFRALVVLVIVGAALWFVFSLKKSRDVGEAEPGPKTQLQTEIDKALKNLEQYVEMSEVNHKVLFTRHKEITLPRMLKYFERRGLNPPVPSPRPFTAKMVTHQGLEFLRFESDLRNRPVSVYFEKTPKGDFLVDWESMVGYCEVEWDLFLLTEPAGSFEFRAYAHWGDYYNHEFSDSNLHKCIILTHVESADQLFAYVPMNSDAQKNAMLILDADKSNTVPCRVKARISNPGSQHRQAIIEEIHPGWLKP